MDSQMIVPPVEGAPPTAAPRPGDPPVGPPPTPVQAASVGKSTISPEDLARAKRIIAAITASFEAKVVGQADLRSSLLIALLTEGHILLESMPGLAKTTAAESIADAVSGSFKRIQCTPDLLPSDIIGTQIYDAAKASFETQLGPVHANFVLLDEINRSSAKTQSAMLEAMQERQTTIGGVVYPLPSPFLVLATQNPIEQEGTYHLPEAQLDRFLLKEVLDYPTFAEEIDIVGRVDSGIYDHRAAEPVAMDDLRFLQKIVKDVYVDSAVTSYIVSCVYVTRHPVKYIGQELSDCIEYGASPRASIAFSRASRALALINGRDYVIPEDVKALRHSVLRHRIILGFEAVADNVAPETIIDAIFASVQTP